MDRYVLEPAAKGRRDYVPTPVAKGLSNVANNLDEPVSFVNRLLEGEPKKPLFTSTVSGLTLPLVSVDYLILASASKDLQVYDQRSFGETLGTYGVDAGTYIVLPI